MRGFAATARMCVKTHSYFGISDLAGQYALRLIQMLAMIMIWRALLTGGAQTDGMTLEQLITYTILSSALQPLLNVRTPASSWLHDGTMLALYQRPSSIFGQLTAHTAGGWAMPLMLFAAPVLGVAAVTGYLGAPASAWFFPSLALSIAQGFAVDFLFSCLLIRMRGLEWTVHSLREALTAMLTGALIPFAAMPWGIGRWLALTPFGTLTGAPLSLYAGLGSAAELIPAQLIWTALLWPAAIWLFARSRERLVSYGG